MSVVVDWCDRAAAKYAVEHWHYSKTMPVSKMTTFGVWEDDAFIGAVIFAWGANCNMPRLFGLDRSQACELVRVAMRSHKAPVSLVVAESIRKLHARSPGVRVIVSYADPSHGHVGKIYQAGNWIYTGLTANKFDYILDGKVLQRRAYTGRNYGKPRLQVPKRAQQVAMPGKHRYVMPLDKAMRRQLEKTRLPYPAG